MTTPELPAEMVEAAARALAAADDECALFTEARYAGPQWDGYRDLYLTRATLALTAALSVREGHEPESDRTVTALREEVAQLQTALERSK